MKPAPTIAVPAIYSGRHSGQVSPIEPSTCLNRLLPGDARGRILLSDKDGARASVRVGAVLHPGMLVADGTGFLQHRDRPTAQRVDCWPSLLRHQNIEIAPA
jgi:hypothetical protein